MTTYDWIMSILTGLGVLLFIQGDPPCDLVGFLLIIAGIVHLLGIILHD